MIGPEGCGCWAPTQPCFSPTFVLARGLEDVGNPSLPPHTFLRAAPACEVINFSYRAQPLLAGHRPLACVLFLQTRRSTVVMSTTTLAGLTTIFTPPSSCSSSWTYEAEFFNSFSGGLLLQNALSKYLDSECFPTGFDCAGRAPDTINVFSPGACPMGYTTATESFSSGTTLAVCCQRYAGYSYSISIRYMN